MFQYLHETLSFFTGYQILTLAGLAVQITDTHGSWPMSPVLPEDVEGVGFQYDFGG